MLLRRSMCHRLRLKTVDRSVGTIRPPAASVWSTRSDPPVSDGGNRSRSVSRYDTASARRSRPALADWVQSLASLQHRDELRDPRRTGLELLGSLDPVDDRVAVGSVDLIEER